jgi:hypothetical protein
MQFYDEKFIKENSPGNKIYIYAPLGMNTEGVIENVRLVGSTPIDVDCDSRTWFGEIEGISCI